MYPTGPVDSGNNVLDTAEIRAAVHALVEGLAPDVLHALWDVIVVYSEGQPPAVPHDEC